MVFMVPKVDLSDSCTVSRVYKDQLEVPKVDLSDSCTVSKVYKDQLEVPKGARPEATVRVIGGKSPEI